MDASSTVADASSTTGTDATKNARLLAAAAPSYTTVATENGTFNVASGTVVRYGAGSSWVSQTLSGGGTCSNTFFGTDPDPGVVKSCQVATAAPAPAPAPSNSTIATENGTFNVASGTVVQYGAGSSWVSQTVSGAGTCSNTFFGTDPDPGWSSPVRSPRQHRPRPPPHPIRPSPPRTVPSTSPAAPWFSMARAPVG